MKFAVPFIALAANVLATPTPQAYQAPPAYKVTNVIYGGSGCPQGSISVNYTSSGILPILFDKNFVASVGSGVDVTESRKNCQLGITLSFSPGFSFSVYSADYVGAAYLDSGVTGTISADYYFSGTTDDVKTSTTISGPYSGPYVKRDDVDIISWSPCGADATLNVNAAVALTPFATSAKGVLAQLVETGRITNNLYFKWKKC